MRMSGTNPMTDTGITHNLTTDEKRFCPYPHFLVILGIFVADQVSKFIIAQTVPLYSVRPIIRGFFNITHIRNKGAIFGAFSQVESRPVFLLLTAASLFALGLVIYYFFRTPPSERLMKVSLALILAGALGNLADRLIRGYVIDFLDFYAGRYHWPTFNVADSSISIGVLFLLFILFRRKPA